MLKAQLAQPGALSSALGAFENALGDLERHADNTAEATMAYQKAKQAVNDLLRAQPENSEFLIQLAWAEDCLGDKANAFAHAQKAIAASPASKDAFVGPGYEDTLARIEAHFGEKDSAIGALQHLLSISYGSPVTRALLRIDPDWDNLRNDPRFQAIVQKVDRMKAGAERPKIDNFFAELKRRNVYKVAVAYIVAGWALSQGIAQVFPVFDVPNWLIRLIVLLIIIGLPIALVLAWMFELTPEGIKRTATADAMPDVTRKKKYVWIYVVVIGAVFRSACSSSGGIPRRILPVRFAPRRLQPHKNRSRFCHSRISVAIPTTPSSLKACRTRFSLAWRKLRTSK